MWLTLRYTGSADAPQRQILTSSLAGERLGGWGMRNLGVAPPKTLRLRGVRVSSLPAGAGRE